MYLLICPFGKTFDEVGVTYSVPDFLTSEVKIGQIVEITLRKKTEYGIILDIFNILNIDFDELKIIDIVGIKNENIFISNYRLKLSKWLAKYYFTAIHNSLNLFLPKNLKDKIIKDKLPALTPPSQGGGQDEFIYEFNHNIILSEEQEKSYNQIKKSKNNKILFYGLTGSGKTEVYIKLIKDNLDKNKQILFLIPEIILTNQLSDKIKKVFGKEVLIINSTVTDATKTKYWLDINSNKAKIIIGTRSALFYPYNNLGLIIIDEEHDNSYISDSSPRYKSIEVAEKITELNGNRLVLGSGTPSTNSMYKAVKKEYELVSLLKVYNKKST